MSRYRSDLSAARERIEELGEELALPQGGLLPPAERANDPTASVTSDHRLNRRRDGRCDRIAIDGPYVFVVADGTLHVIDAASGCYLRGLDAASI